MEQETKELDKLSYALGLSMGHNFLASGIRKINSADFAAGVAAVFDGVKPLMSFDEAKAVIQEFFQKMETQQREAAEAMAKVNAEAGEKFLAENGGRPEIVVTPTGLQYEVVEEGNGPQPKSTDMVKVHYTGRLLDGTIFDSSVERGEPATFGVTQVIPGWVEALQMMKQGAKWRLYIPSKLAYGPNGAGGAIGPNATLIFDVELLEVIPA